MSTRAQWLAEIQDARERVGVVFRELRMAERVVCGVEACSHPDTFVALAIGNARRVAREVPALLDSYTLDNIPDAWVSP